MNDYMVEGIYADKHPETLSDSTGADQVQSPAWGLLRTRVQSWIQAERFWEPVFVVATFALWGWYLFWLYSALQDLTFVPWP
ncbi:MAG: hypothetical protein AB7G75_13010 [Candidatus Binatia bacterium]